MAFVFGSGHKKTIPFSVDCSSSKTRENITCLTESDFMLKQSNPVVYFEIPVNDINRAITFYSGVFRYIFQKEEIDKNEMALFPFTAEHSGISGALAKGEIYKPTRDGVLVYFQTENIEEVLQKACAHGGKVLYPVTNNGIGWVAEFEDTEGNRIALFQSLQK